MKKSNKKTSKEATLEVSEKGVFLRGTDGKTIKIKASHIAVKRSVAMKLAFNPDASRGSTKLADLKALEMYHGISGIRHCAKTPYCVNENNHPGPCFDNLHDVEIYPDAKSRDGADWTTLYITKISST